jgi:Asp-tRNA(Asn)/Glu-tRNA(Gln) amidotransferase A subunit family amidase
VDRRNWLQLCSAVGVGSIAFQRSLAAQATEAGKVTKQMVANAAWIAQLELTDQQQDELARSLQQLTDGQQSVRQVALDPDIPPALVFSPHNLFEPTAKAQEGKTQGGKTQGSSDVVYQVTPTNPGTDFPADADRIAFASIADQSRWLRSGKITSVELTRIYLQRITRYDTILQAVVERLDDSALQAAAVADQELARGQDRGLLHGIPYGAKDLVAIPPWPTGWGAPAYRDQVRPVTAAVADRLREAGAVLIAKLSLGALAMGDQWYAGTTRNPWNTTQGSSGSSAGSASAVAAGLCSFAIGSETLGSIISPCRRCHVTGLRPTFGRVSRAGCMTLSWSMDKLGPIARTAEDCAVVLSKISGQDSADPATRAHSFLYPWDSSVQQWTIGYVKGSLSAGEQQCLDTLKNGGATVREIQLPNRFPLSAMLTTLNVEAATSFDDLLRNGPLRGLGAWPSIFREGQFVPAVHYLRCNRLRTELVREAEALYQTVDVVIGSDDLLLTNLSGHPSMIVTTGTTERRNNLRPWPVKLTSRFWGEDRLLTIAAWLQKEIPPIPYAPTEFGWVQEE